MGDLIPSKNAKIGIIDLFDELLTENSRINTLFSCRETAERAEDKLALELQFNKRLKMDGLQLLSMIPEKTVSAVFFDPQYRGILDKMKYGNEGKSRGKERALLPQMSDQIIIDFVKK